ncbi:MAG: GntR family transcriptional regulator [Melioribacteraceae bacterium]|nr:GntR family transcriptional regulator [Melioribacteraceae bacterium]
MEIDRKSALPLYYQLKEIIKEEIDIGKYKPGDRIPSENELAEILKISRNTAKQAIADLVSEGLLYRIQGKGTFVAEKKVFKGLTDVFSFSSEFKFNGTNFKTKLIFSEEIFESRQTLEYLKLKESSELYRVQRLRLLDDIPVALQTSYLPKFFCPGLLSYDLTNNSLFDILKEKYNLTFSHFTENLTCVKADQYEADLLNAKKGSPLFLITRKTFTKNDEIIEVARSFMPGDRCEFSFSRGDQVSIELNHIAVI